VIPRVAQPGKVEAMLEVGADGVVVQFPDEAAMRDVAGPLPLRVNAVWLVLGIVFAAVVFAVLTYVGRRWRP
jgi:hypothetical protein